MKIIKEHHDLSLISDILLLADVFENLEIKIRKLKELWILSKPLFEHARFRLGCNT